MRNALRAHIRLVVKDAAKVVAVREHLVLVGQIGAAGVDQIDAGQVVLLRHFLRAQVFFDRHGVVGAAFDGGVVADNHAVHAADPANAGNQPGAGRVVAIQIERGQGREFQKRRAGVQQHVHPLARQQLAARRVLGARRFAAAQRHLFQVQAQIVDQGAHGCGVGQEVGGAGVELALQKRHGATSVFRWAPA